MTSTIKSSLESNSSGNPGAPSVNSANNPGQSPRSNPVCLDVNVTIRSLPNQAGGVAQPIREEGKTVIVFDNGAVLRSSLNLPAGLTVILSNARGREVVSRVVGGRNLPSLKGYVEIEFTEPVDDFWGIHQDTAPAPVALSAPQAAPPVPRETPAPPAPMLTAPPRAAISMGSPAKPANVVLGSGPRFEDMGEPVSVSPAATPLESKTEKMKPGPEPINKEASDYNLSAIAKPTSLANWMPSALDQPAEKPAIPANRDSSPITSPAPVPTHDFLSKGLMAYEQPGTSSSASEGRTPLIVGVAALVLAGVCGVIFFLHKGSDHVPVAKKAEVSQPSTPEQPTANNVPEPAAQAPQQDDAAQPTTQTQAQPVSVEQAQPAAPVSPVPAVVTGPATTDARTELRSESRTVRRQEKDAAIIKQTEPSASRRPAIPNLKIGSPNAPSQNHADSSEGAAPITEIASVDASGGTTPAGLLTSAGRISNPPTPPPSAPAPAPAAKIVRDPKLISSVRPEYPTTARQTNIQGSVAVILNIDETGKVVNARALSGPLLLRQAAENSVKLWKYSPGTVDGKPAPSQVTVSVDFRLN